MVENLKSNFIQDLNQLNPLSLAFVGDGVWTLMVREFFCDHTHFKNNNLHKLTTKFVKATYQAKALVMIESEFSDLEKDVSRRARNTKINTFSKNASLIDYRKATCFEAIIGFLYMSKDFKRLDYFFEKLSKNFLEAK